MSETSSLSNNGSSKSRVSKACDTCRFKKIKCSGTIPCTNCANKQPDALAVECTYNYEIKKRLNATVRTSNKQIYTYLNKKMENLEKTLSKLDVEKLNNLLVNSKNPIQTKNNFANEISNDNMLKNEFFLSDSKLKHNPRISEKSKILKMGVKASDDEKNYCFGYEAKLQEQKQNEEDYMKLGKIFLCEEGQIDQNKSSFKLFFYLSPFNLRNLINKKYVSPLLTESEKQSLFNNTIPIAEKMNKLNILLQKDNEVYVRKVFKEEVNKKLLDQIIHKMPVDVLSYIISKLEYSNKYFFVFYQQNVIDLIKKFERVNNEAANDEFVHLKGIFSVSEMNLIFITLLNTSNAHKEQAQSLKLYKDLIFWENILLQYVVNFYKSFTSLSRIEERVEDNIYNIHTLLQLAFYLENSPSPRMASTIVSTCITYIQTMHYDNNEYLNKILDPSNYEPKNSTDKNIATDLKFQMRSLYLDCYIYDKNLSLVCHKPEFLNNKEEAFNLMNQQVMDLIVYHGFDKYLTKEQLLDENLPVKILDKDALIFQNMITTLPGSYIIIQQLKIRVARLHSLAYKYLIATTNENDPIGLIVQKKKLLLENLERFRAQTKHIFGFNINKKSTKITVYLDTFLKNVDKVTKKSIEWHYMIVGLEYYSLVLTIHLSDFEILQNIETEAKMEEAIAYAQNPKLLTAITDCLETTIFIMQYKDWHKFESGIILSSAFVSISSSFNVSLFNKDFLKKNIHHMIKIMKLVTSNALRRGFIDPLKWSAVSVLGASCVKILFELSRDLLEKELGLNFDDIFKEDYFNAVTTLTRLSKEIINNIDQSYTHYKKIEKLKVDPKSTDSNSKTKLLKSDIPWANTPSMENIKQQQTPTETSIIKDSSNLNSPFVKNDDILSADETERMNKSSSDVNIDIEQFFEKELYQLLELDIFANNGNNNYNILSESNAIPMDNNILNENSLPYQSQQPAKENPSQQQQSQSQTFSATGGIFSNNGYAMDEFLDDELFKQGFFQK